MTFISNKSFSRPKKISRPLLVGSGRRSRFRGLSGLGSNSQGSKRTRDPKKQNAVFLALILFALLVLGCQSSEQQTVTPKEFDGPDQEGWNSKITITSEGRISAVVQYGHMERYSQKQKNEVHFDEGIIVDFYNKEGQHTSKLNADRGLLLEGSDIVEAIDNVVAKSDSGITLLTERLKWLNHQEKITTDEMVTITTTDGDTLYGEGFESDPNLTNWTIKKPIGYSKKKFDMPGAKPSSKKSKTIVEPDSLRDQNPTASDDSLKSS